jgi:peptide deformylase
MIRPIVQLGDPMLTTPARPIAPGAIAGETVRDLVRDMSETLARAGGVGLSAPQVGESVRLILAGSFPTAKNPDRPDVPVAVLINPRIVTASDATEPAWEGCLSFIQYRVRVVRAIAVAVEYVTLAGTPARIEASGFYARVLQHEIDHLDGILTLHRARSADDVRPVDEN